MLEKVGKYRILGQIGRGGMGRIFKAHDPVLDRVVALKVISSDADVTDELRARFFREAQACAKLSHSNIITVYDLGEADGHLFIVMEFLDGDELQQLIAQRKPLAIEEKLSMMVQICEGLDYAHQKGIIHRDIKPSNIFVLRNGTVKILDFGIARIATAEAGLTRTGLIMGTLRYMSPEQARGRVDHRSDIFSAGVVFYELLAYRAAFAGEDPMQILEQVRSQEPTPLVQIDPAIPSELSTIIERALRKDPAQRFSGFSDMRVQLQLVRRQLGERAAEVRARVRVRVKELASLTSALTALMGAPSTDETLPVVDEQGSVATTEAIDRQFAARTERMAALVRRAEALQPIYERALELLEQGEAEAAVGELERVVEALPEHARAHQSLAAARERAEELRRRRRELEALLRAADQAFDRGAFAECLEQLRALAGMEPSADLAESIEALREAAAAALAAEQAARLEVLRQAQERAARAQAQADDARVQAEQADAAALVPALWTLAEAKLAEARTAREREAYSEASEQAEEAANLYRRAQGAAQREAVRRAREQARRAGEQAVQARRRAQEAEAPAFAPNDWTDAQRRFTEAHGVLADGAPDRAKEMFEAAAGLYRQAEDMARREILRRAKERAQQTKAQAWDARNRAEEAGAPALAAAAWAAAEQRLASAEGALGEEAYDRAAQLLDGAVGLYRDAAETAQREAARRELEQARELAGRVREHAEDARRRAQGAEAEALAAELWEIAETKFAEASAAVHEGAYDRAKRVFEEAPSLYDQAGEAARIEALRRARERAEQMRAEAEAARSEAEEAQGPQVAGDLWRAAEEKRSAAEAWLGREAYGQGTRQLEEALALYGQVIEAARREALERAKVRARQAQGRAEQARNRAEEAGAPDLVPEPWHGACDRFATAQSAVAEGDHDRGAREFEESARLHQQAEEASRREAMRRARERAERVREEVEEARRQAREVDAVGLASDLWAGAEGKHAAGQAAVGRHAYAQGARQLEEALALYRRAGEAARREALEQARTRVRRAEEHAEEARRRADEVGAPDLAPDVWQAAADRFVAARAAADKGTLEGAARAFEESAELASQAEEAARRELFRRAEEQAREAQERTGGHRALASDAGAARLASQLWERAERGFAEGQASVESGIYGQAAAQFDDAGEVYQAAQAAAHEAARRLEEGREAAQVALEQAMRARQGAEESGAPTRSDDVWAVASRNQSEAQAALAREDYAAAVALFSEARREFERAGQSARAVAETEKRRLAVLMTEARRLLWAGRPDECLARLDEIARLAADHPEVGDLRQRAEARLRDEARRRAEQRVLDETVVVRPEPAGGTATVAVGTPPTAVVVPPVTRDRDDLAATRAAEPTVVADRHGTVVADSNRTMVVRPDRTRAVAAPVRRRPGVAILAIAACAVLAVGGAMTWYALRSGPARVISRPEPSPRGVEPPTRDRQAEQAPGAEQARVAEEARVAEQTRVDEIRRQVAAARQEAVTADAERLVPPLFAAPKQHEEAAEAALRAGNFAGARERLGEALQGYTAASAEARRTAATLAQEAAAQRAQSEATAARQRAEVAAAPRQAGPQWTKAARAQRQGETALGREEYEQARAAFAEAQRGFRDAETAAFEKTGAEERARQAAAAEAERQRQEQQRREAEARAQAEHQRLLALQGQQADAERARDMVTQARGAAEKAGAERHAPRVLAAAKTKDQEAQAAFGRQEYERAAELFRGAQGEYQAATQDAQREGARLAALTQDAERTRVKAAADRNQAVKSEANVLVKPLFDTARAKETEADGLVGRQELVAARQAYQDASKGYTESIGRAQVLREDRSRADAVRARMLSGKAQASEAAPDFAAAIAQERQGVAQYQKFAFKEAGESFRAAADLFAKAVPPPPEPPKPPPAPDPRSEIREVLSRYTQAHEKRDLTLLRKVWPGLSDQDVRRFRDTFEQSASIKVDLDVESIEVSGSVAQAKGRRRDVLVAKDGKTYRRQSRFAFVLARTHLGWHIQSVN